MQSRTISELYADDNESTYSSNLIDAPKSAKKTMKNFTPRRQLSKLILLNFLAKFLTNRKFLMNNVTSVVRTYL